MDAPIFPPSSHHASDEGAVRSLAGDVDARALIPLDLEEGVDPTDHFKGDGRDHHRLLASVLASSGPS